MLKILRDFKLPIILGAAALITVAVTLFVVFGGSSAQGLNIVDASGSVSILSSSGNSDAVSSGAFLKEGDIITVGDGASCTIAYKGKNNSDNNYIIINCNSQVVVNSSFDGRSDGQLYLNRGSLICNLNEKDSAKVEVRTADSMVYPAKTVSKIEYSTDEFNSFTDVFTFSGNSKIQMYDALGEKVKETEALVARKTGRVTSGEAGPSFVYLNVDFSLNDLKIYDLKALITISALVSDFPYTAAELKESYDKSSLDDVSESVTDVTSDTISTDNTDDMQTTVTSAETEVSSGEVHVITSAATTRPAVTTSTVPQTTVTTTTKSDVQTTTKSNSSDNNTICTVTIIINGDETIQEVKYGHNAEKPADPTIDGMKFLGWDGTFENITSDAVITALFEDESNPFTHKVTVIIADKITTLNVNDGEAANIPSTITIDGYTFLGWDTDYSNVRSDITVTALLQPNEYIVNFVIEGYYYPTSVKHGQTAVPLFTPTKDSNGNLFTGWDKDLNNVTSSMTINALFGKSNSIYTVTFIIENKSYKVTVKNGETAVPPYIPITNSEGKLFYGWDKSLNNITDDTVITAVFA